VIILLLASTGMRRGAVSELKIGDLKYIEQYGIVDELAKMKKQMGIK